MKIRRNKGFTLMELLIVVAIICVLVAIAIPVYNGLLEKARVAADAAILRSAKTAFAVQEMTTGKKPGHRAVYDNVSGTFIERKQYVDDGMYAKYKYYGQSYNSNGGKSQQGEPSVGTNAHIYVDHLAEEGYGPDALVWWAEDKKLNPKRWGN
ncbi:MAG: pilin [Lachnospiraceae bacterium]